MSELPLAPMKRILKRSGLRVSTTASETLADTLEDVGVTIMQTSKRLALHRGGQTITGEDVLLAVQILEDE